MSDGYFYCSACGTVQTLGSGGVIHCHRCGRGGLRGFADRPRRVRCPEDDCDWFGWDDGEINDDLLRHLRHDHGTRPAPEWRVARRARVAHLKRGTGTRSWTAACGQYLRSLGRAAEEGDRHCARCARSEGTA